jgi:uncharacterized membrane protein
VVKAVRRIGNMSILHWIVGDSWRRFVVSLFAALIAYFALRHRLTLPAATVAAWNSFATFGSLLAWLAIAMTPQNRLRENARAQDLGRLLLFSFVVAAACVALFSVGILIHSHRAEMKTGLTVPLCLALGTVALSWILLHTVYSLHYAHVYYGDSDGDEIPEGGLAFPNESAPDYLDFAYFSFVVGMTCQVSDVQVTSKRMRRLTLMHGVISFAFNTFILALLINTVSGLL